jgi:hypothetical protein
VQSCPERLDRPEATHNSAGRARRAKGTIAQTIARERCPR